MEVRTDDEGYHGARYAATVIGSAGEDKVMVQYDMLTTDDQKQQLVEIVHDSTIRPIPSISIREHRFNMLEEVDAWYHDGWWLGVVNKVLPKFKYVVYFWTTNEEIEFHHLNLRSHQEFINEKWVSSFSVRFTFRIIILKTFPLLLDYIMIIVLDMITEILL